MKVVHITVAEEDPVVSLSIIVAGLLPWDVVGKEQVVFRDPGSDGLVDGKTQRDRGGLPKRTPASWLMKTG